jgi:hypothetical protein
LSLSLNEILKTVERNVKNITDCMAQFGIDKIIVKALTTIKYFEYLSLKYLFYLKPAINAYAKRTRLVKAL